MLAIGITPNVSKTGTNDVPGRSHRGFPPGALKGKTFATILADPPRRFQNRTGKMAPEHHSLSRYGTMTVEEIWRCRWPA